MDRFYFRFINLLSILILASTLGCRDYQVTFNDRPIYQTPVLLEKIALADPALENCVAQTIIDQSINKIENLTRLICTSAGIRSVSGLEQLAFLQELDLSNNEINKVDSLLQLENLLLLRLPENANIDCAQLSGLQNKKSDLNIEGPAHCQ